MRPRTTCLSSAASMLFRNLSAACKSFCSKPGSPPGTPFGATSRVRALAAVSGDSILERRPGDVGPARLDLFLGIRPSTLSGAGEGVIPDGRLRVRGAAMRRLACAGYQIGRQIAGHTDADLRRVLTISAGRAG